MEIVIAVIVAICSAFLSRISIVLDRIYKALEASTKAQQDTANLLRELVVLKRKEEKQS